MREFTQILDGNVYDTGLVPPSYRTEELQSPPDKIRFNTKQHYVEIFGQHILQGNRLEAVVEAIKYCASYNTSLDIGLYVTYIAFQDAPPLINLLILCV